MTQAQRDIKRKLAVLEHAEQSSNVSKTCRYFGISRDTFYRWKKNYQERGEEGLVNTKPCPKNLSLRTPPEIEEKMGLLLIEWVKLVTEYGENRLGTRVS
jgi:transposase-like protein